MTIGAALGQYEAGAAFGRMAVDLARRQQDPGAETVARFWYGAFSSHWREPVARSVEILRESVEIGQRIGAPLWASYSAFFVPVHVTFSGAPIPEALEELARYMAMQVLESLEASSAV